MKTKLKLSRALPLAEKIKATLFPGCERIKEAGSLRRRRPFVGDIEFVIIPKLIPDVNAQLSLFGDPPKMVSALDILLERLIRDMDNFVRGDKNGENWKNFLISDVAFNGDEQLIGLDLFLCEAANWGYIYALRTGPGNFNVKWVTQQYKGGLLPDRYSFRGGWLYKDGHRKETPEEKDVFDLIGGGIAATDRDEWKKHYITSNR